MADVTAILSAFRVALIDAGLVRRASEADPVGKPPMHVEPLEGPPAPGEREGTENDPELVTSLLHGGDLSEVGYDAAIQRRAVVDVHYRTVGAGVAGVSPSAALRKAVELDAAIRNLLIRPETNYGYGFDLGDLRVHQVATWAGFGQVSRSRAAGYHHKASYVVIVDP